MFQPFIQTLTLPVPPAVRDEPSLHLEFNKRDDVNGTTAKLIAQTPVGDRGVRKHCGLEVRRPRTLVLVAEGGCRDTPSVVVFQSSLHVTRHQRPRVGSRPRLDQSVFIQPHIRAWPPGWCRVL